MEHFEQNITPQKEKSYYTLHLDTTRILILASAAIVLIGFAYWVGSFSFTGKETKPKLANKTHHMLPSDSISIPGAPHSSEMSSLFENKSNDFKPFEESHKMLDIVSDKPSEMSILDETKIVLPITPSKAPAVKTTQANTKKATVNNTKSTPPNVKKVDKPVTENTSKNKNVIEVVSTPVMPKQSGFAIQMGSFDTRAKAQRLSNTLQTEDYDTFIEHVKINGKDAFRVKIGPISNKREAMSMLNELQEDKRYADCWLVNVN